MPLTQFFIVLAFVAGVVGVVALHTYGKTQQATRKQLRMLERQLDERQGRLDEAERRIEVLEKIVTDRRFDLDEQFRDLDKTG